MKLSASQLFHHILQKLCINAAKKHPRMGSPPAEYKPSPLYNPTIHVTKHDDSGFATLHSSTKGKADHYPERAFQATTIYTTVGLPVDLNGDADLKLHEDVMLEGKLGVVKPKGTVCRFADFAPGSTGFMHRTQSVDFGIVLEGNVVLKLDDGSETDMTKGDVAIQRATMHQWDNRSQTEWARVLFVLQDAQPLVVGGKRFKEDLGQGHGIVPTSGNDGD
jgi:hypothetical protein